MVRLPVAIVAGALLSQASMACAPDRIVRAANAWPEADALFQGDLRWVGGDGAYSVDLGADRILWLFGDSLVARGHERARAGAAFLRNSVAIQTGRDPSRAFMAFYYRQDGSGEPHSFLPEQGAAWFWPAHGVRLGETLLLFYARLGASDDDLGYATTGWTAVLVDDPDDEPSAWTPQELALPDTFGIALGAAALVIGMDVYVYGQRGSDHDHYLARWRLSDARRGELGRIEWWCGDGGWIADAQGSEPAVVIEDAAPELSIHYDARLGRYLEFETTGFGAAVLGVRTASLPEGPWSDIETFYRPEESFDEDAFVYAGKAHPELIGADAVLTYVPSSLDDDGFADDGLYYPRFVRAWLEGR
jgi:hypothetical protein